MKPARLLSSAIFKAIASVMALLPCLATLAKADMPIPRPPAIDARSYLLVDFDSGRVLAESNADQRVEPASITKVMTTYVVFDLMRQKRLSLETPIPISEKAWRQGKDSTESRMFLEVGKTARLVDLLRGIIIQSGNDAAVAIAEYFGGSEEGFAQIMNHYAKQLGMKNTHYADASGLPHPEHYTTARDIATMSAALIRDFPNLYKIYAEKEFTYHNIKQQNRNGLLWRDPSVDGIKTGHTESAGYCLAASAKRGDMRLISVVMGTPSIKTREAANATLLSYGFTFYETKRLYTAKQVLASAKVWKAEESPVQIGITRDLYVTVPRGQLENVKPNVTIKPHLIAPIPATTAVGELRLMVGDRAIDTRPLYPLKEVKLGGLWTRGWDSMMLWFE